MRRANRDGHVMRSFETAAIGACMLVEETEEHRAIFGEDCQCVSYFKTPTDAASQARELLLKSAERARHAAAVRELITKGPNTYRDRLRQMLHIAEDLKPGLKTRGFKSCEL